MTTKKNNAHLTEQEKQTSPMPGEVEPKDAMNKARVFASQEKGRLRSKGSKIK